MSTRRRIVDSSSFVEREGDLWEIAETEDAAVAITTNGSMKHGDHAVMGRGCALEAAERYPGIQLRLGSFLILPRPGCGNGRLRWEDVRKILEPILDDRFTVVRWKGEI